MANEKNLIPNNKRSPSEVRENGRKGGINSGKKRREQKTYRELAKAVLKAKIEDEELLEMAAQFGVKKLDVKTLTFLGMVRAAADGSYNAFDRLLELTGEKEKDEQTETVTRIVDDI